MLKKILQMFLAVFFLFAANASAYSDVIIDEENFPDDNFRRYVILSLDIDQDGTLNVSEISQITSLDISEQEIYITKGIEHFAALTHLNCSGNKIFALNTKSNNQLEYLNCSNNLISLLDISGNNNLTYLNCSENNLTDLNLTGKESLRYLYCNSNKIKKLQLDKLVNLILLDCSENKLPEISLKNNTNLLWVSCDGQTPTFNVVKKEEFKEYGIYQTDLNDYISDMSNFLSSEDIEAYTDSWGKDGNIFEHVENEITLHKSGIITFSTIPGTIVYKYRTGFHLYDLVLTINANTQYIGDDSITPMFGSSGGCNTGYSLWLLVLGSFLFTRKFLRRSSF